MLGSSSTGSSEGSLTVDEDSVEVVDSDVEDDEDDEPGFRLVSLSLFIPKLHDVRAIDKRRKTVISLKSLLFMFIPRLILYALAYLDSIITHYL